MWSVLTSRYVTPTPATDIAKSIASSRARMAASWCWMSSAEARTSTAPPAGGDGAAGVSDESGFDVTQTLPVRTLPDGQCGFEDSARILAGPQQIPQSVLPGSTW